MRMVKTKPRMRMCMSSAKNEMPVVSKIRFVTPPTIKAIGIQ
jgi:hypothetical protein